jgi:polyphosphate glucokinase
MAIALGIDIGGSGVKAATVDLATGALTTDRLRVPTPQPATPAAVAGVVGDLVRRIGWSGATGATFPAVVRHGVAGSAANVDPSWIGTDVAATLSDVVGVPVAVLNDADAAGVAEVRFGAARNASGTVVLLTFGTGIGSAVFVDGRLVPNTELGHLEVDGVDAEKRAADSAREREGLSWTKWAQRVQRYVRHVEMLLSPDLFVLGGGVSKQADRWVPLLRVDTPVVAAGLRNNAGIVGAALRAGSPSEATPSVAASS